MREPTASARGPASRILTALQVRCEPPSKTVATTGRSESRSRQWGSASSRSGRATIGEVGGLAGLEAAGDRLGPQGPGAEEGGHREQERAAQRRVASVEEADLVEDAQGRRRGQAVGAEADDDPAFEHRPVRVRGVAEPGVGPRADRRPPRAGRRGRPRGGAARTPSGRGRCRGRSASRPCAARPADVVGGAGADRLPVVVPGAEVFEERPEPAVARSRSSSSSSGISARWVESGRRLAAAWW